MKRKKHTFEDSVAEVRAVRLADEKRREEEEQANSIDERMYNSLKKLMKCYMYDVDSNLEPNTPVVEIVGIWLEAKDVIQEYEKGRNYI